MEAAKGFGVSCVWLCFGIIGLIFAFLGLIFRRDGAKRGDRCFDCEEGRLEEAPEAEYVSLQTLFGKEQLKCTHCGSENTSAYQW